MGVLMGLASSALFGLGVVLVKVGMRRQPVDNGHFMSVFVNVLFLGLLMLFISLPTWSWAGIAGFVIAGLMTTWIGRGASFLAIRFIGPSRGSAILVSIPLFAAVSGWVFLGEGMTLIQAAGGVVISVGLLVLIRSRRDDEVSGLEPDGFDVVSSPGVELVATRRSRIRHTLRHDDFARGFGAALTAAVFYGGGIVVRKWSLAYFPSAIAGAFFGAVTALAMIALGAAVQGRVGRLIEDNLRDIPWWFVACGTTSTVAIVLQFRTLDYLPAWIVSSLLGTQAIWALLWARLFLRHEEPIGWELLVSMALVVGGVALITSGL